MKKIILSILTIIFTFLLSFSLVIVPLMPMPEVRCPENKIGQYRSNNYNNPFIDELYNEAKAGYIACIARMSTIYKHLLIDLSDSKITNQQYLYFINKYELKLFNKIINEINFANGSN